MEENQLGPSQKRTGNLVALVTFQTPGQARQAWAGELPAGLIPDL